MIKRSDPDQRPEAIVAVIPIIGLGVIHCSPNVNLSKNTEKS